MSLLEKEWFIEAPWGRICIVAWGSCLDPPVLLAHGQVDSAASFRPLMRLLPQKFYYVCMELPGNGKSDPYPPGLMISLIDLVYPVELVRRHFRWENFIYMAHSVSATIGRFYQLAYPGRMSKVIELDQITPSLTTQPDGFSQWYDRFFTSYYEKYDQFNSPKETGPTYTWDEAIAKLEKERGLTPDVARATLERWSEPINGRGDLIRFTIDQRMKSIVRPPLSPSHIKSLYSSITTPTLAVISKGSIDKGLYKNTDFLLEEKELNNYKIVFVEGNHDAFILNPNKMAPFISQFLLSNLDSVDSKAKL